MTDSRLPRPRPCASCPYRRDVPSGVWAPEEYPKLRAYDAPTGEQPIEGFACHQGDGALCSGWLACHGPAELLAVRVGLMTGSMDPAVLDYSTDVPLWGSGEEAASHGEAEIEEPGPDAGAVMEKIMRVRGIRRRRT